MRWPDPHHGFEGAPAGFSESTCFGFSSLGREDGAAKSHEQSSQKMVLLNTRYFPLMFDIPDCCTVLKQQNCLNNVVTVFLFSNSQFFYVFSLHAHSSSGKSSGTSGEVDAGGKGREDPGVFHLRIETHSFDQSSQSKYA